MADQNPSKSFFGKKLAGIPVWLILIAAGIAIWWWFNRKSSTSSTAAAAAAPKETTTTTTSETVTGGGRQHFSSNAAWESAAVSYLTGLGINPTEAGDAVYNYVHSKTMTSKEQADVNLAIDGLGPPPTIPAPARVTKPPKKSTKPGAPKPKSPGRNPGGLVPGPGGQVNPGGKPPNPKAKATRGSMATAAAAVPDVTVRQADATDAIAA